MDKRYNLVVDRPGVVLETPHRAWATNLCRRLIAVTPSYLTTGLKRCSRCGTTKPVDAFGFHHKGSTTLNSWCRECRVAYLRWYRETHPRDAADYRERVVARRYGLTLQRYR